VIVEPKEVNLDYPPLNVACFRSRKKTCELFALHHTLKIPDNFESIRLKVAAKINDEYGPVKDLIPINPARSDVEKANKLEAQENVQEEVKILGGHPFPAVPGVSLTPENAIQIEPSEATITKIVQSLPLSKEQEESKKRGWSVVEYKASGAVEQRGPPPRASQSLLLPGQIPVTHEKPEWHPPWKLMRVISGHLGWVRSVAVDSSNEWFATGSADRTIKVWDLASGTLRITLTGHISTVRAICVSERHPYLFSAGEDRMVKCWDLEYNKVIRHYHGHLSGIYCAALHPTLDILITGGRDSTARVWDIRTKAAIHVLSSHTNTVMSLATQGTEPQLVTGSMDTTIKFWDIAAGKCSATLTHHKKAPRSLLMHPKEYSMVSAAADNIKHWKFPEGHFIKNFFGHRAIVNAMAVNTDNVLVTGADNGSMCFWDWKSGYNFQQLETKVQPGSLESEAGIFACCFDQTSSRLITCEADKTIKVWKEDDEATQESHPIVNWRPSKRRRY